MHSSDPRALDEKASADQAQQGRPAAHPGFDRTATALAVAATLAVLVLPIFFIPSLVAALYDANAGEAGGAGEAGATVGLAVILRAALRRMFQGGFRVAMQTSVGNLSRAITRAVARRELRLLLFTAAASLRRQPDAPATAARSWRALALGGLTLALSFWVLLQVPLDDGSSRLPALLPQGGPGAIAVAALAAVPLAIYALAAYLATRLCGARLSMSTGIDSVLIQLYFAAGGSFLPLATDSHYLGTRKACARSAAISLALLLLAALFFHHAADWWPGPWPGLQLLAPLCVVYAFVYAFPIMPLDGAHLWRVSRWLWALAWGICLAALVWLVPRNFDAVL